MDVRNRIRDYHVQRNWSLNHLAIEANLNPNTVANWFNKKATPGVESLGMICEALGITLSEFFNEDKANILYPTESQKELLAEWDLLHKDEKADFLNAFKTMNRIRKESNPL